MPKMALVLEICIYIQDLWFGFICSEGLPLGDNENEKKIQTYMYLKCQCICNDIPYLHKEMINKLIYMLELVALIFRIRKGTYGAKI